MRSMVVLAFLGSATVAPSQACVRKENKITSLENSSDFAGEPDDLNTEVVDEEYVPSESVNDSMWPISLSDPEGAVQDVRDENEIPSEVMDNSTLPTDRILVQNFGNDDLVAKIVQRQYLKTEADDNSNGMPRRILRFMGEDSDDENSEILDEDDTI